MIFVTGGTGLAGSHLLLELLRKGEKVRALKRPTSDLYYARRLSSYYGDDPKLLEQIEWVDGDVLDYYSLTDALRNVEQVYHCAAVVSFNKRDAGKMIRVNARGTANVVNACLDSGVKRLGHVSSIAALGRPQNNEREIDEKVSWKGSKLNTRYAVSKFAAEREVWRGIAEGLPAFIVNPTIILGIGDPEKGSPRLFSQVYHGLPVYPTGINGFVDARDVAEAMILLMEKGVSGERYILNAVNISYRELFTRIAALYGKKGPSIVAKPVMLGIAWRLEKLRSLLTGNEPAITEETARTSSNKFEYSSRKIMEDHSFAFREISETLADCARFFKEELSAK